MASSQETGFQGSLILSRIIGVVIRSPSQKEKLLAHFGVDYYIIKQFDTAFSRLSPHAFVKNLKRQVDFRHLLVGFNFRFGHRREGNVDTLRELSAPLRFDFTEIQAFCHEDQPVSSSRIRQLVREGAMVEAAELLARPYFLEGTVQEGRRLGRTIGAPTANLKVTNELLPRFGVYASWAKARGSWYRAITNVGTSPTVDGHGARVETHLFDFEGDLYGADLLLCLGSYLRDERKFENIEKLSKQIHNDFKRRLAMPDRDPPSFDWW